ncbi:MAG: hypothetical protein RL227_2314, partial [Pseudomonadota bacterium]
LAREALDQAAALPSGQVPVVELVRARLALALQQPAQALPPEEALPLLEEAVRAPALPLQARLAQVCLALCDAARAHRAAERAAGWLVALQPLEMTPAAMWLTLAQAAQPVGDEAQAQQAVQKGLAFVEQIVAEHLDAVFHDGWRRQNPVNAALLALAARTAVAPCHACRTPQPPPAPCRPCARTTAPTPARCTSRCRAPPAPSAWCAWSATPSTRPRTGCCAPR